MSTTNYAELGGFFNYSDNMYKWFKNHNTKRNIIFVLFAMIFVWEKGGNFQ